MASSLFNLRAWQSFNTISVQVFFGLPVGLQVDVHTGQLVIQSATVSDSGLWECVASNEHGQATATARLNRIGLHST